MKLQDVLKLIVDTKSISPFTRSFAFWLYENNYLILSPDEKEKYLDEKWKKSWEESHD